MTSTRAFRMSDIGKTSGIKIRLPRKKKLPESTKRSAKRNSPREQAEAADQSSEVVDGNDSAPVEDEEQIFRLVEKTAKPGTAGYYTVRLDDRAQALAEVIAMYGNIPDDDLNDFHSHIKAHIISCHGLLCLYANDTRSTTFLTRLFNSTKDAFAQKGGK